MAYPFPGMDPWLENPIFWHSVHQRLVTALADDLAARLRPHYFVGLEIHKYITIPDKKRQSDNSDATVTKSSRFQAENISTLKPAPFIEILIRDDPVIENYLVVRNVPNGENVTAIELLSHTNKQPGRDRETYLQKREELLETKVNLVEIDLLRANPPMPYTGEIESDYRILARHRARLNHPRIYSFPLRSPIPIFPLPLLPDDQEPLVNLNELLAGVYERAGYDLVIDYAQPPIPALSEQDATWANELLTTNPL